MVGENELEALKRIGEIDDETSSLGRLLHGRLQSDGRLLGA